MKTVRLFRKQDSCGVLGPGKRAVIWVQGCGFRCPGCLVPESWNPKGGRDESVESLVEWVLSRPQIEGLTLSGGEPFNQPESLLALVDGVLQRAPHLSLMSYSGYTLEWLSRRGRPAQKELLNQLDILVDGRYIRELHGDLLWRGSTNQRIHVLSERYRGKLPSGDRSQGLELEFSDTGTFTFSGVPPWADYAKALRKDFVRV